MCQALRSTFSACSSRSKILGFNARCAPFAKRRPHVAQALLEAEHVQSIEEAFEPFIGRNGPAYFEGFRMSPADAVQLIHGVGGLAAWAHPNELDGRDWREYL